MVTISRRDFLPFLAPILAPTGFSVVAPNSIQAEETPSFLQATATPTEPVAPPVAWQNDLERSLTTYGIKQYPEYDVTLYPQEELNRIHDVANLRD
jgi:hypothetical protein